MLVTPFDHLRAIAGQLFRCGSKTDADAILNAVQNAEAEHAALVAVAEAAKALLAHHRISDLRKLNSDTLTPRFEALDAALRQQQGSEVAK